MTAPNGDMTAPLDVDAIGRHARQAAPFIGSMAMTSRHAGAASAADVPDLLARVAELEAMLLGAAAEWDIHLAQIADWQVDVRRAYSEIETYARGLVTSPDGTDSACGKEILELLGDRFRSPE